MEFFAKIAKHKNAYISKTVLDRVILTKFLTHRVSLQSSHANLQKIVVSPKMAAILNFFAKIAKHKNGYISKTVLDRAFSTKFLTHRVSLQTSYPNFEKKIYCVNTSYPMDNLLNRSAQTGPPNVRKRRPVFPPAGRSVVLCTHQMAPRTSFLSRQPDVIASFSFGACTVQTCFQHLQIF